MVREPSRGGDWINALKEFFTVVEFPVLGYVPPVVLTELHFLLTQGKNKWTPSQCLTFFFFFKPKFYFKRKRLIHVFINIKKNYCSFSIFNYCKKIFNYCKKIHTKNLELITDISTFIFLLYLFILTCFSARLSSLRLRLCRRAQRSA